MFSWLSLIGRFKVADGLQMQMGGLVWQVQFKSDAVARLRRQRSSRDPSKTTATAEPPSDGFGCESRFLDLEVGVDFGGGELENWP